ncbi:MAG TPA: ABC transporter substrate-binding protein [Mycobacteriales bacterium]|nr:ABC transporter substrate-binding protein [Mycobacteriales bacterium]
MTSRTLRTALAVTTAIALAVSGCGGDGDTEDPGGDTGGKKGGTLVFGSSADPVVLDGAFVSDGESLRVIRQMFETLVTTKLGGTDIEPELATEFSADEAGTAWSFKLREGVKFHDGTDFNAAAVCTNFDRWYNFKGLAQSSSVSYYWNTVMSGFAKNEDPEAPPSLYKSCEAKDAGTAVINLTAPSASFLAGLALPAFSIASPKALTEFNADKVSGTGDAPKFDGTFGTEHPVGTGPFKFSSWVLKDKLELVRNDDYWGEKAKLDKLIFKPIADGPARRQALEAGDIQGYDFVDPSDVDALKGAGFEILERPAFNVAYVGFNQAKKPLDNPKIRQAIAHALNRDALLKAKYPAGAEVATQFMPPELFGHADDVAKYDYDPAKAKALIAESGVANPTVEFWYPTNVSRPYMPDPVANFQAFKADLEAVGFKVVPKSAQWNPEYLASVDAGTTGLRLLGWTGDFGDPDNFVGTFFRTKQKAWGFDNPEIFKLLEDGRTETDLAKRTAIYQEANRKIMEFLPGIPYAHTKPSLAFRKDVKGYRPSPVSLEPFSLVSMG